MCTTDKYIVFNRVTTALLPPKPVSKDNLIYLLTTNKQFLQNKLSTYQLSFLQQKNFDYD